MKYRPSRNFIIAEVKHGIRYEILQRWMIWLLQHAYFGCQGSDASISGTIPWCLLPEPEWLNLLAGGCRGGICAYAGHNFVRTLVCTGSVWKQVHVNAYGGSRPGYNTSLYGQLVMVYVLHGRTTCNGCTLASSISPLSLSGFFFVNILRIEREREFVFNAVFFSLILKRPVLAVLPTTELAFSAA